MMNALTKTNKSFLNICGLYFFVFAFICSSAEGKWLPPNRARQLQEQGYPTDTVGQIIEATRSKSYYVRHIALELLTQRIGKEAIPALKGALKDPEIRVRWGAAHLLETLGDKSGLGQMRKDFEELSAKAAIPLPTDPNMDPDTRERIENERKIALHDALDVAKVLAELDDRQGYELAAKAALEGTWDLHRDKAIYVLTEITKTDPNILSAEGRDPVSVLCAMAEAEKNETVFSTLVSHAGKLDADKAIRILEKAVKSPHQPEKRISYANYALNKVKASKRSAENQSKDPNSCCDK